MGSAIGTDIIKTWLRRLKISISQQTEQVRITPWPQVTPNEQRIATRIKVVITGEISDLLGNIMNQSGHIPITDSAPSNTRLNEDTMKIIEANAIVEESAKDKFPDLPSTTMQTSKTETSLLSE